MTLATADKTGMPSARMVLLKSASESGFVFYTNFESKKGLELDDNPRSALVFHWKSLKRQVRVSGTVEPVSYEEADVYFASRSRGAQIGAWAGQGGPLGSNSKGKIQGRLYTDLRRGHWYDDSDAEHR